ncbi:serine hydrolase domain-containing protein [Ectobacillus panaciterrae]|uniref:serine hydrolase domain-containing protein n=1 Tax=Ectobacillus panaciterrae TaxID=363872 RepID=UPI0004071699|nr:serine hydrolase domain-containing protein [Ectobacillus panaciterrae]
MHLPKKLTHQFSSLADYTDDIRERNGGSAAALVIIHKDRIVTEHYSGFHSHRQGARPIGTDSQFHIASARKSYIGFAAALALYEESITSLDDPVSMYLPELDSQLLSKTTIRHLLTHTHGLNEREDGTIYREFLPGTTWAYRNINVTMIAEIVKRTMGKSVGELLREHVFYPLALTETGWKTEANNKLVSVITETEDEIPLGISDEGHEKNLFVSARELAYWGYLHIKKGNIYGKQIVPSGIFDLATSIQSPPLANKDLPQNGFFWYTKDCDTKFNEMGKHVPNGSYQILGVTGPLLLVIPEHNLVVARMYNKRYNYGGDNYLHYLREFGNQVMRCL